MDYSKLTELRSGKDGERLDIQKTFDWVFNEMSYKDFCNLAQLRFQSEYGPFAYRYCVDEDHDSPERRRDYIEYLCYKLVQNVIDPQVQTIGK